MNNTTPDIIPTAALAVRVAELEAENERLRAALRPFADVWDNYKVREFDDEALSHYIPLSVKPYADAARALES